jgi:hypothetical protein
MYNIINMHRIHFEYCKRKETPFKLSFLFVNNSEFSTSKTLCYQGCYKINFTA